ncbi:DUF4058 family protein [Gemmata sp.]|uniref:DUF4058 family protein n=1 Tax=Gemmata sp. TaxID=1914242 RepID=UPI003F6E8C6A
MPSPFPGMNPYLERESVWSTFRLSFICAANAQLAAQLPEHYIVQVGTRKYVTEPPPERRHLDVPDVEKCPHVLIRDLETEQTVTLIEFLSPVNKYPGAHRERYMAIREEILRSRAHFIEIDLLRGGPRMPPSELPTCDYCAIVSRVEERPEAGVWPWRVRDPLPVLPVPLRAPDPDATLDLKAVVDRVYDEGRYANYVYGGPPEPRLAPDDAAWAAPFLPPARS